MDGSSLAGSDDRQYYGRRVRQHVDRKCFDCGCSIVNNQWWLLMGDDQGTLRYLHSYDEIMKGKCQVPCCSVEGGGGSAALITL